MSRALLIGRKPEADLGWEYVTGEPYEAVVIGSLTLGQVFCFGDDRVLNALNQGKPVTLYTPGLPQVKNRALASRLAGCCRELKSWGIRFTDGARRHLITAEEARALRRSGKRPGAGAVLTPLAKEILEGSD